MTGFRISVMTDCFSLVILRDNHCCMNCRLGPAYSRWLYINILWAPASDLIRLTPHCETYLLIQPLLGLHHCTAASDLGSLKCTHKSLLQSTERLFILWGFNWDEERVCRHSCHEPGWYHTTWPPPTPPLQQWCQGESHQTRDPQHGRIREVWEHQRASPSPHSPPCRTCWWWPPPRSPRTVDQSRPARSERSGSTSRVRWVLLCSHESSSPSHTAPAPPARPGWCWSVSGWWWCCTPHSPCSVTWGQCPASEDSWPDTREQTLSCTLHHSSPPSQQTVHQDSSSHAQVPAHQELDTCSHHWCRCSTAAAPTCPWCPWRSSRGDQTLVQMFPRYRSPRRTTQMWCFSDPWLLPEPRPWDDICSFIN